MSRKPTEINSGDRYGSLIILEEIEPHVHPSGNKSRRVREQCYCGNEKEYFLNSLRTNDTVSCGCYKQEKAKETHTSHGLDHHPLYNVWRGIKNRCLNSSNKDFKNYGAIGITVCDEWKDDVESFIK